MVLETLGSIVSNNLSTIVDVCKDIRTNRINKDGILIAYRFEVTSNLTLLNDIKIEKLQPEKIRNKSFIQLVNLLENSIGLSMVFSQDRTNLKKFKSSLKREKIPINEEIEAEGSKMNSKQYTLFDLILNSVSKINALKHIISIVSQSEQCDFLPNYFISVRVRNIREYLEQINNFLPNPNLEEK